MRRIAVTRRTSRHWAALVLVAVWSIAGTWDVSHAAEHADTARHASLHHHDHDHDHATSEVAMTDDRHGHDHRDAAPAAVSTAKPRLELDVALPSVGRKPSAPPPTSLPQAAREDFARGSPDATGPFGPRGPPLS